MAFPTLGSTATGECPAGTTRTIVMPGSVSAGNLLLGFIAHGTSDSTTWPAGWTELLNFNSYSVGYKLADGSESGASVNLTTTNVGGRASCYLTHRWAGGTFRNPEAARTTFSNTVAPDPPSLSPTWGTADTVWFSIVFSNNRGSAGFGYATGYPDNQTEIRHSTDALGGAIRLCTKSLNASSEDPGGYAILGSGGTAVTMGITFSPVNTRSFSGICGA